MSNEDMGKKEEAEEINLEEIDEYLDSLNLERKQNLKISDDLTLSQIDLDEIDNYLNELAFEHLNMAAPSNEMQIVGDMIDLKACTAHKVQGSTVPKPQKLTINTNDAFGPAMIYVMLSRVSALSQIWFFKLEKISEAELKMTYELAHVKTDTKNQVRLISSMKKSSIHSLLWFTHCQNIRLLFNNMQIFW